MHSNRDKGEAEHVERLPNSHGCFTLRTAEALGLGCCWGQRRSVESI
uniref:Uncharacterized protein n=1 Tax=Rhizophora mucronata TaxID=61149 RepID=A0A2P2M384_RHIMU